MLFAWILWTICTLLTSSHLKQLSHRCVKHSEKPFPSLLALAASAPIIVQSSRAAYHLCAQHTHVTHLHLCLSLSSLSLLRGMQGGMDCGHRQDCGHKQDRIWGGTRGSRPGVTRSGVFEESDQFCQFSLSQAKEVSRLSSAGSSRSAAGSCWTSL